MTGGFPEIQAVILAGGLGTRLRSVVADRPKALAEINGRPFLSYLLHQLHVNGILRVVICTGHLGEQVENSFAAGFGEMSIAYSRETVPLGTAGALRNALPLLDTTPLLVINGDSYLTADLPAFLAFHRDKGAAVSMLLTHMADASRYGRVDTDHNGSVLRFVEKGTDGPGWINAGIYLMERAVIEAIAPAREVSLEREVLPRLIGNGFAARQNPGHFIDIGTPQSYRDAAEFFAAMASPPVQQRKTA